jgi:hypothetical protein
VTRPALIRLGVLVGTVSLSWAALTLGAPTTSAGPQVGEEAERDYIAQRTDVVVDAAGTERAREAAADAVEDVMTDSEAAEESALGNVEALIDEVEAVSLPEPARLAGIPAPTTTTSAPPTETTQQTEQAEVERGTMTGLVFLDVDRDGSFDVDAGEAWSPDGGRSDVGVVAVGEDGSQFAATTGADGSFELELPVGVYKVYLDTASDGYPEGFVPSGYEDVVVEGIECGSDGCEVPGVGLAPNLPPLEERVAALRETTLLLDETLVTLAGFGEQDLVRDLMGMPSNLAVIEQEAISRLTTLFIVGVESADLDDVQANAARDPRGVSIDGEVSAPAGAAVNELVSRFVQANRVVDVQATEAAREAARATVADIDRNYRSGDVIIRAGDTFNQLEVDAINATGANTERTVRQAAMFGVLAVLVSVLGYYLARFRAQFWERPRMVALLGILIVLAAGSVRIVSSLENQSPYILPAVAFGYLAAVLFDNRMGTLMALAMGVLAAVGTGNPGLAVYGTLATLAPIGFVSSVSSRRSFRSSVIVSALTAAVIAASCSWFFGPSGEDAARRIGMDALAAGSVALVASLVALAAMPFFEAMFDITTTLRLLELTDRNHEALQLIQEKAFGTFNHSLMVGTLADAAAKAIGANNLLARAAAYYHDIGKTENPTYYIENQFGIGNPHDDIPPEQSAVMIRKHVIDGMVLADRHKIPSEVAEGIVSHHGDGIMRYFYEKARQQYGADTVDPADYRHAGHKPRSREMAILMMADSVEGACRAVFVEEEPTPDSIAKVVNRVIDEKVGDNQLSECDLTLGELTRVRRAFIEALIGHYHQRIPYPNFPGS